MIGFQTFVFQTNRFSVKRKKSMIWLRKERIGGAVNPLFPEPDHGLQQGVNGGAKLHHMAE